MCVLWKELDNRIPKTKEGMPMLAVGIDVSKSKSAAAILNQDGTVHTKPFEFHHNQSETKALIEYLKDQNQQVTILMENTGHYHYPILKAFEEEGLSVCLINAYQMKSMETWSCAKQRRIKRCSANCQVCS